MEPAWPAMVMLAVERTPRESPGVVMDLAVEASSTLHAAMVAFAATRVHAQALLSAVEMCAAVAMQSVLISHPTMVTQNAAETPDPLTGHAQAVGQTLTEE